MIRKNALQLSLLVLSLANLNAMEKENNQKSAGSREETQLTQLDKGVEVAQQEIADWFVRMAANVKGLFSWLGPLKREASDILFTRFAELPGETQQEIIDRLVPSYLRTAKNIKGLFYRLGLLKRVSKKFSAQLKVVCSKKGVLETIVGRCFSGPLWGIFPKQQFLEILLNSIRKHLQNHCIIKDAEKAVVALVDYLTGNQLALLASGAEMGQKVFEKQRDLLVPALLDACPSIAHLALFGDHRFDILRDNLIKIADSPAYSAESLNAPSSEHRLLLQEMLDVFPTDNSRQEVIDAYGSKGITLERLNGINESNVARAVDDLSESLVGRIDLMRTLSEYLNNVPIIPKIKNIWIAAQDGDEKTIKELLKTSSFGMHAYEGVIGVALCFAALQGHVGVAQELLTIPCYSFVALLIPVVEAMRRENTGFVKVLLNQNLLSMQGRDIFTLTVLQFYLELAANYDQDLLNIIASILQTPQLITLIEECRKSNVEGIRLAVNQNLGDHQELYIKELNIKAIVLIRYGQLDGLKILIETTLQTFKGKVEDNAKELLVRSITNCLQALRQMALQSGHRHIADYLSTVDMQHYI
jgi:hypothetical protein